MEGYLLAGAATVAVAVGGRSASAPVSRASRRLPGQDHSVLVHLACRIAYLRREDCWVYYYSYTVVLVLVQSDNQIKLQVRHLPIIYYSTI